MKINDFKYKQFEGKVILLCVRWYLKYLLSFRNLKDIMMERAVDSNGKTMNMIRKGQVDGLDRNALLESEFIIILQKEQWIFLLLSFYY